MESKHSGKINSVVAYPTALQRCKFDASLLSAGLLAFGRMMRLEIDLGQAVPVKGMAELLILRKDRKCAERK